MFRNQSRANVERSNGHAQKRMRTGSAAILVRAIATSYVNRSHTQLRGSSYIRIFRVF